LESLIKHQIGNFTVIPFDVKHDAAEPLGFLIKHEETGLVLFATDTYFVPYNFPGLNNILIEANYRMDLLEANIKAGKIPAALRDRTLQSHMSLATCLEALQANDLSKVNNIVLIHLSDGNSNADEFRQEVHRATGKTVHVADKGMKIKLSITPF
jgi:phosphoribosyl 1,2-cyclic phosphodiesterase